MRTLSQYRKAIGALLGALATWAVTAFPDNHQVQLVAGAVSACLTALAVSQLTNTPPGDPGDQAPAASAADPEAGVTVLEGLGIALIAAVLVLAVYALR